MMRNELFVTSLRVSTWIVDLYLHSSHHVCCRDEVFLSLPSAVLLTHQILNHLLIVYLNNFLLFSLFSVESDDSGRCLTPAPPGECIENPRATPSDNGNVPTYDTSKCWVLFDHRNLQGTTALIERVLSFDRPGLCASMRRHSPSGCMF